MPRLHHKRNRTYTKASTYPAFRNKTSAKKQTSGSAGFFQSSQLKQLLDPVFPVMLFFQIFKMVSASSGKYGFTYDGKNYGVSYDSNTSSTQIDNEAHDTFLNFTVALKGYACGYIQNAGFPDGNATIWVEHFCSALFDMVIEEGASANNYFAECVRQLYLGTKYAADCSDPTEFDAALVIPLVVIGTLACCAAICGFLIKVALSSSNKDGYEGINDPEEGRGPDPLLS